MSESYSAQLTRVQAAIAALEADGAAEVDLGNGQRVKYVDLRTLYAREERLIPLAAREARSGGLVISRGSAR